MKAFLKGNLNCFEAQFSTVDYSIGVMFRVIPRSREEAGDSPGSEGTERGRSQDRSQDRCHTAPSSGGLATLHLQEQPGAQAGPPVLQVWEEEDSGGQAGHGSSVLQSREEEDCEGGGRGGP